MMTCVTGTGAHTWGAAGRYPRSVSYFDKSSFPIEESSFTIDKSSFPIKESSFSIIKLQSGLAQASSGTGSSLSVFCITNNHIYNISVFILYKCVFIILNNQDYYNFKQSEMKTLLLVLNGK